MEDRLGIFLSARRFDVPFAARMEMIRDAGFTVEGNELRIEN